MVLMREKLSPANANAGVIGSRRFASCEFVHSQTAIYFSVMRIRTARVKEVSEFHMYMTYKFIEPKVRNRNFDNLHSIVPEIFNCEFVCEYLWNLYDKSSF